MNGMNKRTHHDVRCLAALAIADVINKGRSLADALPARQQKIADDERPLLAELCYGTLRFFYELDAITKILMQSPLREKDADVRNLLLVGLYQLRHMRLAEHTSVNLTVNACKELKKTWAEKLLNGVLRNYLRRKQEIDNRIATDPQAIHNHPCWLIDEINHAWPDHDTAIFSANNNQGHMVLRINSRFQSVDAYQKELTLHNIASKRSAIAQDALILEQPVSVSSLPDFFKGACSVQDIAAQLCAPLLDLAPGQHVLDACCAPGGKTGHILELEPALASLLAIDSEEKRLPRVRENLARLHLNATILCADASQPENWHDEKLFDRILLDAPCSGTGVIRRHPDIKHLRRPSDITHLAERQTEILEKLWPLLKPGGILLYTTCSILPQENEAVIAPFVTRHADAETFGIPGEWGIRLAHGKQLLPSTDNDGFYYARLKKTQRKTGQRIGT
ncbi:MAG TPA: 16S rRNA (cytosine(967)-C(5))-methyltransferase RsmB [Pseudomonadales bacterium]|nr:16S rRNA (cytosine(967)-C(5))-methyltransferase RsmB [Pseudomonadales bacterium]